MKKIITFICILQGFTALALAQTNIPATISADQMWTPGGSPYILTQRSYVDSGVTIKVLPGTVIKSLGFTLHVNGSIEAVGTSSFKIQIDSVQFEFSATSLDYDSNTQKGCQFNHCIFRGLGFGSGKIIKCYKTDLNITNSEFYGGDVSIVGISSSINIDYCKFDFSNAQNMKRGMPLQFVSGNISHSEFTSFNTMIFAGNFENNIVKNFNTISLRETVSLANNSFDSFNTLEAMGVFTIEKNKFSNFSKLMLEARASCTIKCNTFIHGQYGVELTEYFHNDSGTGFIFENNTLDSMGGTAAMLSYLNNYGYRFKPNTRINYNNFLTRTGTTEKLIFKKDRSFQFDQVINTKFNYWGTTDSAIIESYIKDSADANIDYRADFSDFATSKIATNCSPQKACKAKFGFTVDADTVTFMDSSTAVNAYTRTWIYGDGSNGGHTFRKHLYNPGTYNACLAIVDNVTGCRDTFCTTIEVKGKSSCQASYYFGIDTSKKFSVYLINDSKGITNTTQFLWDFGDGTTSTQRRPKHTYGQFKKYKICLTLKDSTKNCFSTYCDSVGKSLISSAFTLEVVYEWELTSTKKMAKTNLHIYPNPTKGKVYFDLDEELKEGASIKVLNPVGELVLNKPHHFKSFIDMSGLPNGVYIIHVSSGNKSGVAKVILNK